MTDLNKLRSEFEKHQHPKVLSWMFFDEENNIYQLKAVTINEDKFRARSELNFGWSMWQKAKAQAVPTWIGVKDEEPPTDTMVLICWSDSPDVQPEIDYMTCDEDL
ncbi:hypothetical protein FJV20_19270, partial [Acinetobacter baumannii]|uniref:hypothetical protein n=1 Tax=Acinetobacter baumannii TaxID=470 RepID=UPI00112CB2CE